jgi:hypothetical protein
MLSEHIYHDASVTRLNKLKEAVRRLLQTVAEATNVLDILEAPYTIYLDCGKEMSVLEGLVDRWQLIA